MIGVLGIAGAEREVEVVAKAQRRRFSAEYRRRILREADGCKQPGELGALLLQEGLCSAHLAAWRAARQRRELAALGSKRRGPKRKRPDARDQRIAALEREVRRLQARAERAEALVEVQENTLRSPGRRLARERREALMQAIQDCGAVLRRWKEQLSPPLARCKAMLYIRSS